jgi:hypothetical protein
MQIALQAVRADGSYFTILSVVLIICACAGDNRVPDAREWAKHPRQQKKITFRKLH